MVAAELACNDDAEGLGLQSQVSFPVSPNATYFIHVDSFRAEGAYVLNINEGACGDGGDPPNPQPCGGIAGIRCPEGFVCIDNPEDNCDPDRGGADCPGICAEPALPGGCNEDGDCPEGEQWCRATQEEGVRECVDYQAEGEFCGGFTPAWAATRCHPDQSCTDHPVGIADAPGVCRAPCVDGRCRNNEQYCSFSDFCRDDSACRVDADCEAEGNDYAHIECVGHGVCNGGQCGYECGNSQCIDLEGVDFGNCRAILGWGVREDACAMIGGCDARGFNLFDDERGCVNACGGDRGEPLPGPGPGDRER